ncbi:collagen alpha-1(II) chain-like [Myotis daubentonii]|uniref:collagen alpha-1(II) chain-like n=1 Tax=Myotis daubentonii TaxID=98922 RepID=UPI00287305F2|nr:collagen alpha-1(II) chain-like [Myotis daubentonii]
MSYDIGVKSTSLKPDLPEFESWHCNLRQSAYKFVSSPNLTGLLQELTPASGPRLEAPRFGGPAAGPPGPSVRRGAAAAGARGTGGESGPLPGGLRHRAERSRQQRRGKSGLTCHYFLRHLGSTCQRPHKALWISGARRRAPATRFSLRAAGGRLQGPASPPSSRRSDSRIRGPKGASALTNRSGAVGLRDPATRCPQSTSVEARLGGDGEKSTKRNFYAVYSPSRRLLPSAGSRMQDPLDRSPSPRNAGSPESTLWLPGVRADRDFPGQVTRSAAAGSGSGAEARPDSQEGPERVGGCREGVPAGVHRASPCGVLSPSCRARGRLRAPPPPRGGGETHVVARLRPGAMEIGGATMPAGEPGV